MRQSPAERHKNRRSRNHLYNQLYSSTETQPAQRRQTPFSLAVGSCTGTQGLTGISHPVSTHPEPWANAHGVTVRKDFGMAHSLLRDGEHPTALRSTGLDYTVTMVLAEKNASVLCWDRAFIVTKLEALKAQTEVRGIESHALNNELIHSSFHAEEVKDCFLMVYLWEPNTSPPHVNLEQTDSLPAEIQAFRSIIFVDASMLLNREHNFKITISFGSCIFKMSKENF